MDSFDFSYLEPRGQRRLVLHGVHARAPSPVVLVVEYVDDKHPLRDTFKEAKRAGHSPLETLKAIAPLAIVDWENVNDKDGQPVPYTREGMALLAEKLHAVSCGHMVTSVIAAAMNPRAFAAPPPPEALGVAP